MTAIQEIHNPLQVFQNGYTRRDLTQLDAFMELFTLDVDVIGTNGVKPSGDEWYLNRDTARELI